MRFSLRLPFIPRLAVCAAFPLALLAKDPNADMSNPAYRSTEVTQVDNGGKPAAPAGFIHPGVMVNRAQLDAVKARIAAGTEPQKSAFAALKASPQGALAYAAHPWKTVECGPFSDPDLGCKAEQADSEAAYAQALLWYFTGDDAYARNAIRIMDSWADTLRGGHLNENGPAQAAWCAEVWPRAAEIMRYSYPGWTDREVAAFQRMLRAQYLPSLIHGCCENGNKELAMSEALINVGVFNDDRATFDLGLRMWRGRTPAYIYLKSDGPKPVMPVGCPPTRLWSWGNKGHFPQFVDGLLQETARDSNHANLAFSAMVNAAETARQQGVDLYGEQAARMMAAMEFQAQYLPPNHGKAPPFLAFHKHPTWEIAYNHFHNRLGRDLPMMAAVIPTNRPTGVNHMMNWETLTHGDIGDVGLPPVGAVTPSAPAGASGG